jgi:hypothetical protein
MVEVHLYELLIWCQAGSRMAKKELLRRWEFDWDKLVKDVENYKVTRRDDLERESLSPR